MLVPFAPERESLSGAISRHSVPCRKQTLWTSTLQSREIGIKQEHMARVTKESLTLVGFADVGA